MLKEDITVAELLTTPREFTAEEIAELAALYQRRQAANPIYQISNEAVLLHWLISIAQQAARRNQEAATSYPKAMATFDENRLHNKAAYPWSLRPVPAKKLVIGLISTERCAFPVPAALVSDEPVCEEMATPGPPPQEPGIVSMRPEPSEYDPTMFPCLPDDTAPIGYTLAGPDGKVLVRSQIKLPFGVVNFYRLKEIQ